MPNNIFILGDEILAVNGSILHGLSHGDAIAIFKSIRSGPVVLQVARRNAAPANSASSIISHMKSNLEPIHSPPDESMPPNPAPVMKPTVKPR